MPTAAAIRNDFTRRPREWITKKIRLDATSPMSAPRDWVTRMISGRIAVPIRAPRLIHPFGSLTATATATARGK